MCIRRLRFILRLSLSWWSGAVLVSMFLLPAVLKLLLRREQHEPRPTVPASVGDRLRE